MRSVFRLAVLTALFVSPAVAQDAAKAAKKDSTQKLGAIQIIATPSGRGETRNANAVAKTELQERSVTGSLLTVK